LTKKKLEKQKYRVDWSERSISLVDPQNILKRGYSITTHNGIALKDAAFIKPGDTILTRLSKGLVNATVSSSEQQKNDQE
jgi:exodeoxyribonuclease VII large subunit